MAHPPQGGRDHYRPRYRDQDGPPPPPPSARDAMYHFTGNGGDNRSRNSNGRQPQEFSFRSRTRISDRPLLRTRQGSKEEEEQLGGTGSERRFRNVEDMTDSDEADMEGDSADEEDNHRSKRTRRDATPAVNDDQPKWSNPDPYTALPAPSETTGKKLDFVKLIRKARNEAVKAPEMAAQDGDFISFGIDDNQSAAQAPANAPTGPRTEFEGNTLGKRKRGDKKGKLLGAPGRNFHADGLVLDQWCATGSVNSTPWLKGHADESAIVAFHKEIIDFFHWVRPTEYEYAVRDDVVQRLGAQFNRLEQGQLKAFGSYAAGLYLPTGDMDLVWMTRSFVSRNSRYSNISQPFSNNQFYRYKDFIVRQGLAKPDSVQAIRSAKVPIIKFVERVSGLKVDLSFNNDTGVVANETFQSWKSQYPAMPILVSVVKQYLMIRGLNDVSVGGVGGFSTICLVTSLIQHMPLVSSPANLGEMLIEFFNLYGNLFDRDNVAIRMEPPGYVDKNLYASQSFNNDKKGRLMIIDPNRSDNNISGGSREIERIFACFSRAHDVIETRLKEYELRDKSQPFSFLEDIVGGDFGAYEAQRLILYNIHYGPGGAPAPAVIPPPPPPISHTPIPPPPASPPGKSSRSSSDDARGQSSSGTKSKKKVAVTKSQRRAARMKQFRPELAHAIRDKISVSDALKLGRYKDTIVMNHDLNQREKDMAAKAA